MIDLVDTFEQAWQRYRGSLEHPERCQADAPPRPDIGAYLVASPTIECAAVCRDLVYIDLEYTVKLRPRWGSQVLPAFWARWAPTLDHLWCLAPYYYAEFRAHLDRLDLLGFERWEYSYSLRGDPQRTFAQYLERSLPDRDFFLSALGDIDAYPPWDEGPQNPQELRSWLRDVLYLDVPDWEWAYSLTHQGAYPRTLLRTLQQRPAFWAQGLAASAPALSAFQVDMLLEGASARLWCGPFLLLHSIGSGGMGTVWFARDPGLNRAVAIKRILPHLVSPDFEQRFRQEARRSARLKHPHIAAVHLAPPRGELFIAMELVGEPGSPLGQDGQPVSLDQVVVWLVQILQALAYAHGQGIVHRDLKPQNLIVDEDGKVVLVDYGLGGASQSPVGPATVPRAGWRRVYAATWSRLWPWLWPLLPLVPPGSPVWEPLPGSVQKPSRLFPPTWWASGRAYLARAVRIAIWGQNECAKAILHYPLPDELTEGLKHFEGSAEYAAPEQWVHPTVLGPPVDIYPLGHIVIELLVGQPPFRDSQKPLPPEVAIHIVPVPSGTKDRKRHARVARLQAQHVFIEPPVPPELKQVTMPQGLVTLIKAMLTKHPEHRPSADQLVRVLEPYLRRGGLLLLVLFVWGLIAALGAGGLTVLWMRAIGGTGTDEPHGLDAAVWAILSTAPMLAVAAWVRCRYELQSLRQQLPACLFMLVAVTVGATWFYSARVGDTLGLRQWFEHQAPLGFVGREMCLAGIWASMSSLPGFALLRGLLNLKGSGAFTGLRSLPDFALLHGLRRLPDGPAWAVAVGTSLGVLGVFFLLPWWGAGLLGGLAALVWLGRGLLGLRGCSRWSFPQWFGPVLPVLAVVGIVVPFVLLLGDQSKAEWVRGVLAGVALRLGLFWGFLLLARRVPWGSVDCVQPATRSVTQRDASTGTP